MRIGIFIGSMGSAPDVEGQVQQVVNAERDGFDSFWSAQVMGVDALTLHWPASGRARSSWAPRLYPYTPGIRWRWPSRP